MEIMHYNYDNLWSPIWRLHTVALANLHKQLNISNSNKNKQRHRHNIQHTRHHRDTDTSIRLNDHRNNVYSYLPYLTSSNLNASTTRNGISIHGPVHLLVASSNFLHAGSWIFHLDNFLLLPPTEII